MRTILIAAIAAIETYIKNEKLRDVALGRSTYVPIVAVEIVDVLLSLINEVLTSREDLILQFPGEDELRDLLNVTGKTDTTTLPWDSKRYSNVGGTVMTASLTPSSKCKFILG